MRIILNLVVTMLTLAIGLVSSVPTVRAQDYISNTAFAIFGYPGPETKLPTNTVRTEYKPSPTMLSVLREAPTGGVPLKFKASFCGASTSDASNTANTQETTKNLSETDLVRKGEMVYFRVSDPALNTNSSTPDLVNISILSTSGDAESITIRETGPATGVFIGSIRSSFVDTARGSDCRILTKPGDRLEIIATTIDMPDAPLVRTTVDVALDQVGHVFDSSDGSPLDGVKITLVDAVSGAPARVYSDDGVTPWPSTVISGENIVDAGGTPHPIRRGEYRFPVIPDGIYRLVIDPPSPLIAPSLAPVPLLGNLMRTDGKRFAISDASFSRTFEVKGFEGIQADIPVDQPAGAISIDKSSSKSSALPGDVIMFTVNLRNQSRVVARAVQLVDTPSSHLRYRPNTVRINGKQPADGTVQFSPDGKTMTINLSEITSFGSVRITYAMSVRADANAGQAFNRARVMAYGGPPSSAGVYIKVEREDLASRATFLGRVIAGACTTAGKGIGIPGVRVMMEDGSFSITDADGRYRFEGVVPGNHVLQVAPSTLPQGGRFVDCARSTRSAGSAISRFVSGQGGNIAVADFHAEIPETALKSIAQSSAAGKAAPVAADGEKPAPDLTTVSNPTLGNPTPGNPTLGSPSAATLSQEQISRLTDDERRKLDDEDSRRAAGGATDWMNIGAGPTEFLFPAVDHNPRAPAVRVVIRHQPNETVELQAEGKTVDPITLDSFGISESGAYAVSIWRGIPIDGDDTRLTAIIRDQNGTVVQTLTRDVHFASVPAKVEFLQDKSNLVADGKTKPVVALRVLDRFGKPLHSGLTGDFTLSSPYESAEALAARQSRSISGMDQMKPRWFLKGDDGIAYVELAPTMSSGKLRMTFEFKNGTQKRRQELETWIQPGKVDWTIVGLAEAGAGSRDIASSMERNKPFNSDLGDNARIALYMRGQIVKGLLVTGTYDSAKQRDEQSLLGSIDPRAYYTVFADSADRRFDASSREKLYLRVEGKGFTGFYGDFQAGFDQTQLARYQRAATGIRAEAISGGLQTTVFAARIASTHRRDEIQGAGITGPYRLSSRSFVAGSEVVVLEVRDRLRSEVIVSRKPLTRFVDYEIDLLSGSITFREPILSRDPAFNPQFVIIDYEIGEFGRGGNVNAGARASFTTKNGNIRIGATALTDTNATDSKRSNLGGVDVRARIGANTEARAEIARSFTENGHANAWLVEAEHHSGKLDVLAYVRSADMRFGLGQMSGAERGRRKIGLDTNYRMNENVALTASAWNDTSLNSGGHRNALQLGASFRSKLSDARIGVSMMQDTQANGERNTSTTADISVSRRFFDNKLELSAGTSLAVAKAKAADLPSRYRMGLRYAVTRNIRLIGSYELSKGEAVNTRSGRAGLEITPWTGGRVTTSYGRETTTDNKRAFASVGATQSMQITPRLTADVSVESVRTLSNIYTRRFNAEHPNSSGGALGDGAALTDDFTAASLGLSWRSGRWVVNNRVEWRNGKLENRRGLHLSVIRQIGEGSMFGGTVTWTNARKVGGASSTSFNSALAFAYRPIGSTINVLGKVELRSDMVSNASKGEQLTGSQLLVEGDAKTTRVIGSMAMNWSPYSEEDGSFYQRSELGLFGAVRYNFDTIEGMNLAGATVISGVDARLGLGQHFEIGGRASVRASFADGTTSYSTGPEVGVSPTRDMLLTFGYNVTGYHDQDFAAAQYTNAGPYAGIRLKFDANSFPMFGTN